MSHHAVLLGVQEASATHSGFDDPFWLVFVVENFLPSSDPGAVDDVVVAQLVRMACFEAVVVDERSAFDSVGGVHLDPMLVDLGLGEDVIGLCEDGFAGLEVEVESLTLLP